MVVVLVNLGRVGDLTAKTPTPPSWSVRRGNGERQTDVSIRVRRGSSGEI